MSDYNLKNTYRNIYGYETTVKTNSFTDEQGHSWINKTTTMSKDGNINIIQHTIYIPPDGDGGYYTRCIIDKNGIKTKKIYFDDNQSRNS